MDLQPAFFAVSLTPQHHTSSGDHDSGNEAVRPLSPRMQKEGLSHSCLVDLAITRQVIICRIVADTGEADETP